MIKCTLCKGAKQLHDHLTLQNSLPIGKKYLT